MNLLIAEDERMAREGLLNCLDWAKVGITKVFSAENGEAGLFMARRIMPDIVLTDIRMPRMDGITMANRIREILPECRIIFLSAYSEIDYYKAAIALKAVRYLDKPIEPELLRSVIMEAVAECEQLRRYKSTRDRHQVQEKQRLADAICAGEDEITLEKEWKALSMPIAAKSRELYCTPLIISLRLDYEDETQEDLIHLAAALGETIAHPQLCTIRHKNRMVFFLLSPSELSAYQLDSACKKLQAALSGRSFAIAVGKPCRGLINANKAYLTAKAALRWSYLLPWGQVTHYHEDAERCGSVSAYAEERSAILRELSENHEKAALFACQALYEKLRRNRDLVYQKARELYFEIISEVFHKADSLHLHIKEDEPDDMISWIVRIENYNLDELHAFLSSQVGRLFAALEEVKNEKKQILAIKDYIMKRYADDTFSISDISAFLHMSASHLCTMFKKETGDTINNYLTEYRLSKAKQYLKETLFSVAEISAKVGYKDNSYFGRIFRKRFGMTPNEYRNR